MIAKGKKRRWRIFFVFSARFFFAVVLSSHGIAQRMSALATPPQWQELERFQETITREEFVRLLHDVYAPGGGADGLIDVRSTSAIVHTTLTPDTTWSLLFAKDAASAKPVPRFWRAASELGAAPSNRPLAGAKVALDPGHLGGAWARVEERWFRMGNTTPVTEGDMTLRVAELLAPELRALGAEVELIRRAPGPTTLARPGALREVARAELAAQGKSAPRENYVGPEDGERGGTVQFFSELLFYRAAEIRHRGDVVNRKLRPDLTICLHFNAEAWGDPAEPDFVPRNHFHVLVNGSYSAAELRNDDVRFEMLFKLLDRSFQEELSASENIAAAVAHATGLPAYEYTGRSAQRVGQSAYVWARNLLANRVYRTPVVYLEPYVMNNRDVWERVQAGDYEGLREVGGRTCKSIYREYADAVAEGLRSYFEGARARGAK
jgi:N-acetylmuramoyl-L-alanine amidase